MYQPENIPFLIPRLTTNKEQILALFFIYFDETWPGIFIIGNQRPTKNFSSIIISNLARIASSVRHTISRKNRFDAIKTSGNDITLVGITVTYLV